MFVLKQAPWLWDSSFHNRFPSGNYPASEEDKKSDVLVNWCHGAPGVALTLVKAAKVHEMVMVSAVQEAQKDNLRSFNDYMMKVFEPAAGTPVPRGDGVSVTCKYPSDPTVALGCLSVVFLIASTVVGYLSLFYPYKGKAIPQGVLFKHTTFSAFFNIALFTAGLAATMLLWPTITEQLHLTCNVHHDLNYECPTAKTGLLGGGAFLSLDSALLWLIALMLADNAREDFFLKKKKRPTRVNLVKPRLMLI